MTALDEFERLEGVGLFRPELGAQRVEVGVAFGKATLTLFDRHGQVIEQWSLAAVRRKNPKNTPALYHVEGDEDQLLELDDETLIGAIDAVQQSLANRIPPQRRVGTYVKLGVAALVVLVGSLVLPPALRSYGASVLSDSLRVELGQSLLDEALRLAGPDCRGEVGLAAIQKVEARFALENGPTLSVAQLDRTTPVLLPGNVILMPLSVIEQAQSPDVLAGWVLSANSNFLRGHVLRPLLEDVSIWTVMKMLAAQDLSGSEKSALARAALSAEFQRPRVSTLLNAFDGAEISTTAFAKAENMPELLQRDPYPAGSPRPLLKDGEWVGLRDICRDD